MILSKALKISLLSLAGALILSATILFPLVEDINKTLVAPNHKTKLVDNDENVTTQIISKGNMEQSAPTLNSHSVDNPSLNSYSVESTNDSKIHTSDTLETKLLLEDIPHHKRN